jgi:hypothetical protein
MNRWMGMLVVGMAGLFVFSARPGHAPPALLASPDPPSASTEAIDSPLDAAASDSVRIEHELIGVRAPKRPKVRAPRLSPLPAVRQAQTGSRNVVARASRVLVGNGRYRPEPFPRPGSR